MKEQGKKEGGNKILVLTTFERRLHTFELVHCLLSYQHAPLTTLSLRTYPFQSKIQPSAACFEGQTLQTLDSPFASVLFSFLNPSQ